MTHEQRGRITVDLNGNWRLYSNVLPSTAKALGTVIVSGETGALIYFAETKIYARLNAQVVKPLNQRKVIAAIEASSGQAS